MQPVNQPADPVSLPNRSFVASQTGSMKLVGSRARTLLGRYAPRSRVISLRCRLAEQRDRKVKNEAQRTVYLERAENSLAATNNETFSSGRPKKIALPGEIE